MTAVETVEQSNTQMGVPLVEAEKIPLECSHKVCTSTKCMTYIKEGNKMQTLYKCKQKYIPCISSISACDECGCGQEDHVTITYETTFTITTENARRGGTRIIRDVLVRELQSEQLTTIKKHAQCALFLKSNALLSHNETINRYFKHFIENRDRSEKTTF